MSLKYRNASGVETPVAGLNGTSGELVPSNSLLQSGTLDFGTMAQDENKSMTVTFQTPMPDANYEVTYETLTTGGVALVVFAKSATGFILNCINLNSGAVSHRIRWQAFRLITDEAREADEAAIAQNTSDIANKCLKYTQLTSADNINNLIAPGNYGGYNGDGVGGTFPYTGNSQFSLLVTRAREYRYQLLQSGADVWQRYTGVSGDVPTGWSTWIKMLNTSDSTSSVGSKSCDATKFSSGDKIFYQVSGKVVVVYANSITTTASVNGNIASGLPAPISATYGFMFDTDGVPYKFTINTNTAISAVIPSGKIISGQFVYIAQ